LVTAAVLSMKEKVIPRQLDIKLLPTKVEEGRGIPGVRYALVI